MLTREDDIDAHALHKRGWKIAAIARHLGRDRKTIRAYLRGERTPGQRARAAPDPFEPYVAYCAARADRGPAPVGVGPDGRAGRAGVHRLVSDPDAPAASTSAAAAV